MKRHTLTVTTREVTGKKVKSLRKQGIIPANIYGAKTKSIAVQLPYVEFVKVFKETGETSLVDLKLDTTTRPVLIHNVQLDYITQKPIHADFFEVNLKEKVSTYVPLTLIGEAKAVTENLGLLLQTLDTVLVEALPADLPEKIEVDVTHLAAVGDQITVAELKTPKGVEIVSEPSTSVVKIGESIVEEEEPVEEATAEGEDTEEGKATTEAAPEATETEEEAE